MNRRSATLCITAALAVTTIGLTSSTASAHHTTVTCVGDPPGTWLIENSEDDKSMTFTTNHGHVGAIPAGGSTTVVHDGTELEVSGLWSNGNTAVNSGDGDCTIPVATTTTSTSPVTTTTDPGVHHPDCPGLVKDIPPGDPTPVDGVVWVKAGDEHVDVGWHAAGYVATSPNGHAVSHVDVCPADDPNPTTTTTQPASTTTTEAPSTTTIPPSTSTTTTTDVPTTSTTSTIPASTSTVATSTPTTTSSSTTTTPETSTTSTPPTTEPSTSTSVDPTTTTSLPPEQPSTTLTATSSTTPGTSSSSLPATSSTTLVPTTVVPSTGPLPSSSEPSPSSTAPTATSNLSVTPPVDTSPACTPTDLTADGDFNDPGKACDRTLPATGSDLSLAAVVAGLLLLGGGVIAFTGRPR